MALTTNDEDLLILSDDNDIWSEFVLDEQIITDDQNNSWESELITFDSDFTSFDVTSNSESNEVPSLKVSQEDENDFMLSFDQNEVKEENSFVNDNQDIGLNVEKNEEPSLEENVFSLWNDNLDEDNNLFSQESTSNTSDVTSVWTMTDILDEAIVKFAKREELIASDISLKENHIKELKNQISALESAVNTDNEEVTRLNTEKQSILKNRKALEKMKETPETTK